MHTHCIDKKSKLIQRFASNFDNFYNEIWNDLDQVNVVMVYNKYNKYWYM